MTGLGMIFMAAVLAAPASPATPAEGKTTLCATQVEASGTRAKGESPQVDAKLEKARKRLPGRYATYKYLGEVCWDLAVGDSEVLKLVKPYSLNLERDEDGKSGIRVGWVLRKAAETMGKGVVEFQNHGFFWVGGPTSEGGAGDLFVLLHAHW